jgi:coenzyme F420-reducing hydrogenase beta subunit
MVDVINSELGPMEKFRIPKGQHYCLHCGLCLPYCKRREEGAGPSLCKECLFCYSVCPRLHPPSTENPREMLLGTCQKIWHVRSIERPKSAQNAGIVTLMVKYLLEEGVADAALLTGRHEDWFPEPFLATKLQEVEQASGTKYSVTPALSCLKEGISRFTRLAVVGLPCQMAALKNFYGKRGECLHNTKVVFTIGLFCMNSFVHGAPFPKGMKNFIEEDLGIPIEEVNKIEILKGKVRVYSSKSTEPLIRNVRAMGDLIWPVCLACADFTCSFSDVSVGSVGSEDSANTVITRTDEGNRILEELIRKGQIEAESMKDPSEIKRIAEFKKSRKDKLSPDEIKFLHKTTVLGNWLRYLDRCVKGGDFITNAGRKCLS